jgi:hypothetical protein
MLNIFLNTIDEAIDLTGDRARDLAIDTRIAWRIDKALESL